MGSQNKKENSSAGFKLGRGHIVFYPTFLGAGLLFATFLNAIRYFPAELIPDDIFSLFSFLESFSMSATLSGLLFFLLCFGAMAGSLDFLNQTSRKYFSTVIGFVCMAAGMAFVIPLNADINLPRIDPSLFGCLFGIGAVILGTLWGSLFSKLEPENILFNTACSLTLGGILHFLGTFVALSLTGVLYVFALLIVSALLLFLAFVKGEAYLHARSSTQGDAVSSSAQEKLSQFSEQEDTSQEKPASSSFKQQVNLAWHALWMPLIGACLSCFIFGLTWDPIVSGEPSHVSVFGAIHSWKQLLGPLLASIPIALIVMRQPDSSALRILNQAVYPLAVALLLALPVVTSSNMYINSLVVVSQQASFAIIVIAVWSSMASVVKSTSLKSFLVFPFCFALFAGAFGIGLNLIYIIGTEGRMICLLLLTLYLALIAISFALANKNEKRNRVNLEEGPPPAAHVKNYIEQCCDELSAQYALSPREKEVLYYLGRGYNHGYIASKLYISENTVRTHVRHIYSKLEISSREELLSLIDSLNDAGE